MFMKGPSNETTSLPLPPSDGDGMTQEQFSNSQFRVGIHLGDVVEESDGDLMGDSVNIAARLEGIAKPGAICLSEDAYRQVKQRLDVKVSDLGAAQLKNITEPIHAYSPEVGQLAQAKPKSPVAKRRLGSAPLAAAIAALVHCGGR